MIFWIENEIETSYDKFIEDLNNNTYDHNLDGYTYYFRFIKKLTGNNKYRNIDDLITYLNDNAFRLNFKLNTSGTTSMPKKVDVNLEKCIRQVKRNEDSPKIWGMCYPVQSFASKQVFFQAFFNQNPVLYCFEKNFKDLNDLIIKYKVTNLTCTPTFLNMLIINARKINQNVKTITVGGEKITKRIVDSYKSIFTNARLINIYASTESGSLFYSNSDSFKIPQKYFNLVKIVDNELLVHQSLINNSSQNKIIDGWFHTGDIIKYIDRETFVFSSRKTSDINMGGYKLNILEIEEEINNIDGIMDVRVYGKSNSVVGSILCADIMTKILSVKEIKEKLKNRLEKHMIPVIINIVSQIKLSKSGKKYRIS